MNAARCGALALLGLALAAAPSSAIALGLNGLLPGSLPPGAPGAPSDGPSKDARNGKAADDDHDPSQSGYLPPEGSRKQPQRRQGGHAAVGAQAANASRKAVAHTGQECSEWPRKVGEACDQAHKNWWKLSTKNVSEQLCAEMCSEHVADLGIICCYISPTAGCWLKPGSRAFSYGYGDGRSITCAGTTVAPQSTS
mmetsp:Transcript_42544/g.110790  ORF Transcript_42544/g.110790 Transcript_42544/m.110790 type:complete len:196 (-) Transcript_42544:71-658(-)